MQVWIGEKEERGEDGKGTGTWTHWDGSELPYKPKWDFKRQPDNWVLRRGGKFLEPVSMIFFLKETPADHINYFNTNSTV